MAEELRRIGYEELVKVRKDEMQGMRPGFYAEVSRGNKSVRVYSPRPLDKASLKVKGVSADD